MPATWGEGDAGHWPWTTRALSPGRRRNQIGGSSLCPPEVRDLRSPRPCALLSSLPFCSSSLTEHPGATCPPSPLTSQNPRAPATHTHRGSRPLGCGYVAVIMKQSSGRLENRRERDHSATRPGQRPLRFLLLCTPRLGADTAVIRKSAQSSFLLFFEPHPLLLMGFLPGTAPSPAVGHTACSQRPCYLRASWV